MKHEAKYGVKYWGTTLLCVCLLLVGCSSTPKNGAGQVRIPLIHSTPTVTGLVILKVDFIHHTEDSRKKLIKKNVMLAKLEKKGEIEPVYALVIEGTSKYFDDSFMIIVDAEPGDYKIVSIEVAHNPMLTQRFTMDKIAVREEDLSFTVLPGVAKFVGVLRISNKTITGEDKMNATLFPDPKVELQAWQRFVELYPGYTDWKNIVQKRIDVLTRQVGQDTGVKAQ